MEDWENEKVMIEMPDDKLAASPIVSPSTLTRKSDPSIASSILGSEQQVVDIKASALLPPNHITIQYEHHKDQLK